MAFIVDIFVNFRTIYRDSKTDDEIRNWKKISARYLFQGRFIVDLMASLPLEVMESIFGTNENLKFLGMLKLIRLLRLGRMITFLKANRKLKFGMKILQLIFMLLMCIHWMNCAWYYITVINKTWFPPKDIDFRETKLFNSSYLDEYIMMYYYGMLTLVANELIPTNSTELVTGIILVFIGSIIIGITIGEFANLLSEMGKKERAVNEELDTINTIMLNLRIPEAVQSRVSDYYDEI